MVNAEAFAKMKDGVIFLNFSRDKLMDDDALEQALASGKVKKYVTDFTDDRVINFENTIVLPHLGASSAEAEDNCASMAVDQMMDYIENGNIVNSVNFPPCTMGPIAPGTSRVCIIHKNVPAILSQVTGMFGDLGINVENMINQSKGDFAYTLLSIAGDVSEADLKEKLAGDEFISVRVVK